MMCKKISPILDRLEEDDTLKQYVEPMKEVTLVRLIKEVGVWMQCEMWDTPFCDAWPDIRWASLKIS